jgi:hypothetical protein
MTKFYIHNIFKSDYGDLLSALHQENEKNLNATLIVNEIEGVRTLPASESILNGMVFPRSPLITFSESTLLIAGFMNNVYSIKFFESANLSKISPHVDYRVDMPSFINHSAMERKMNPLINQSLYEISWPKYTLKEFSFKIDRVIRKTKSKTIEPRKVYNCPIPFANRFPHRDNSLLTHNEVHLRVGMHNVRSIAIHSKDLGDYARLANALKLHGIISTQRSKILAEIDQPEKTGLNKCIDIEILKIKMIFQKFVMFHRNNRLNQLFPSYAQNERMRASFASKKRKNKEFEIDNPQNQVIWIAKQNDKISQRIFELEEEMKGLHSINIELIKNKILENIDKASCLADLNSFYIQAQQKIKLVCDKAESSAKDKGDNSLKSVIIKKIKQELERDVFFERYDPFRRTGAYFEQIDLARALIEKDVDLAELIKFCYTNKTPDALLNLYLIMSKNQEYKKLLLQEFNKLNLELRTAILKFIITNFINLDFLKEIIIERENYLSFTNLIITRDFFTNLDSFKKNQLIKFLIEDNNLRILFKLVDLGKIKIEEIRDQISQFSDLNKLEIIKKAINSSNLIFVIKLLEEKAIQDILIIGVIANYSPQNKKKIIKCALDNCELFFVFKLLESNVISGRDVTEVFSQYSIEIKANIIKMSVIRLSTPFISLLLSTEAIEEAFLLGIINECDNQAIKNFVQNALMKSDERLINLVKNLLLKKIIEDSSIFFTPRSSYLNLYFNNLNYLVSGLRMEGCTSLKEYLIKTKKYEILGNYINLQYSLKSQESQELIRSLNFNELMQDAIISNSEESLRLALFLITKSEIVLEKLNDGDFKKLICFVVKKDSPEALKILLSKNNINNDELIDEEHSLFNYSFLNKSKKILEFLINRNSANAFQSSSAVIGVGSSRSIPGQPILVSSQPIPPSSAVIGIGSSRSIPSQPILVSSQPIPQRIEVQDARLGEPVRQQNNFDIMLQSYRGNFSKITDSQIDQLVESIATDEKKINLSNLLGSQVGKTIAQKSYAINETNQKLIIFFKKLATRNLVNIEDIDLSGNQINADFIKNIILNENYKNIFKRLKKLNLKNSLFLNQTVSIRDFFAVIKYNIEDLNLISYSNIAISKEILLLDNLMQCQNLKRLYFWTSVTDQFGEYYGKIIALNKLKELNIIQQCRHFDSNEVFARAFKENNTLQILKIERCSCGPELIDVLKFNYTLLKIGLEMYSADLESKSKQIEKRNERIFRKGEELFGKDKGIFLGQKLKEIQKTVERYIDDSPEKTKKIETIMDIVITELLESPRVLNLDNLMHKINEKNEELSLNDLQKTNLETEFRKKILNIYDKKRSQPDSGLVQGGTASNVQRTSQPFSSQQVSSRQFPSQSLPQQASSQPLLQQPSSQSLPQQASSQPLLQQPSSQSLPQQQYSYSQITRGERIEKSGAGAGK